MLNYRRIASWIYIQVCMNSDEGNYMIYREDIEEKFNCKLNGEDMYEIVEALLKDFNKMFGCIESDNDSYINLYAYTDYVVNYIRAYEEEDLED